MQVWACYFKQTDCEMTSFLVSRPTPWKHSTQQAHTPKIPYTPVTTQHTLCPPIQIHSHTLIQSFSRLTDFLPSFLSLFSCSVLPLSACRGFPFFLHVLVVLVDGCMVNAATELSSCGESVLFILTSSNKSPFFMPILDLEYARNFCKFSQKIVLVQKSNHLFIWKKK